MAIFHFTVQVLGRGSNDKVVAAAAYRSGTALRDQKYGMVHDYTHKAGVRHSEILAEVAAPEWIADRETLWNAVEAQEDTSTRRATAQLAREIELALHRELSEEQNLALVRRFVGEQCVDRGMVADFSIHERPAADGGTNPHAHILLTMRRVSAEGFDRKKERAWNSDELVETWRERWATFSNEALEAAGSDARIDHRTLAAQGILREPTIHMGKDAFHAQESGEEPQRVQLSMVERSLIPFERQIEQQGHISMEMTPELGYGWFDRLSSYTNRVTQTVQGWYGEVRDTMRGWVEAVRREKPEQGPSMER